MAGFLPFHNSAAILICRIYSDLYSFWCTDGFIVTMKIFFLWWLHFQCCKWMVMFEGKLQWKLKASLMSGLSLTLMMHFFAISWFPQRRKTQRRTKSQRKMRKVKVRRKVPATFTFLLCFCHFWFKHLYAFLLFLPAISHPLKISNYVDKLVIGKINQLTKYVPVLDRWCKIWMLLLISELVSWSQQNCYI